MDQRWWIGTLVVLMIGGVTLWLTRSSGSSPRPISYTCAQGDTLRLTALDSASVRLTLPDGSSRTMQRTENTVGTTYQGPDSSLTFWTTGPNAVLHRGREPIHVGCSTTASGPAATTLTVDTAAYGSTPHTNGWRYALRYPRSLEISRPDARTTRFLYTGPNNDPPALTDGFTVTIRFHTISETTTVQEYIDTEIERQTEVGGSLLRAPDDTTHGDRPAIWWRQESGVGTPVTHWAIALSDSAAAIVSTSAVGADTASYEAHAQAIRASLQFWRPAGPTGSRTTAPLALLRDPNNTPERGCDDVVFVNVPVARTASPLATALDTLFSLDRDSVGGARHFLSQTNETLHFDRAEVSNDTAHVHLTGHLSGLRGVCDNPRARIQIEETSKRVAGVEHVVLYRNGQRTDLQPDGRGSKP